MIGFRTEPAHEIRSGILFIDLPAWLRIVFRAVLGNPQVKAGRVARMIEVFSCCF